MNILFILNYYRVGGVQTVTHVLANKFIQEGHNSYIYCLNRKEGEVSPSLLEEVQINYSELKNEVDIVLDLKSYLVENSIDFVVNQYAHLVDPIRFIKKASKNLSIPIISVYHNSPGTVNLIKEKNRLKKVYYVLKAKYSMRYVFKRTNSFILLSNSFTSKFKRFINVENIDKVSVISNPITVPDSEYNFKQSKKQKEIIYIGRLDYNQKRVDRIIDTWSLLEHDFPDWKLTIVGDGPCMEELKKHVKKLKLFNVNFQGFKEPYEYYRRSSILILTSEYEGFPLVVGEAMSFGVVPVVYGSYSSVYDIISNNEDGIIIPYNKNGFNHHVMSAGLKDIMNNRIKLESLSEKAIKKSLNYSIELIYANWVELINNLKK